MRLRVFLGFLFLAFATVLTGSTAFSACLSAQHSASLDSFALSKDATRIAAAASDGSVFWWDVRSGKETQLVNCHTPHVTTIAFVSNSYTVALGDAEGVVQIFDLVTGRLIHTLTNNIDPIEEMGFSDDGKRAAVSQPRGVSVWVLEQEKKVMSTHDDRVATALALSHDGALLVTGGYGTMNLWDVSKNQPIFTLDIGEGEWVDKITFARDDQWIVSAQNRNGNLVWDARTGRRVKTLQGQPGSFTYALTVPDPHTLLLMTDDGTLRSWNLDTGQVKASWKTWPGYLSSDGQYLLRSTTQPGRLELWHIDSHDSVRSFLYQSPLCVNGSAGSENGDLIGRPQGNIFENVTMGRASTLDGIDLEFTTYATADCTTVTIRHGDFATVERAREEFRQELKLATKIIDQGPRRSTVGEVIGERAVILIAEAKSKRAIAEVLLTNGRSYYAVSSASLQKALEFEKKKID
jgi:WD40 repeat protein